MTKKVLIFCLFITLTACSGLDSTAPTLTLDATALYKTAVYQVTLDAPAEPSSVPTQTLAPTNTPTTIPTIDRTRPPIQSPTPQTPCDKAAAGHPIDVTIPDGTVMNPGERFSKTWRLENAGSCTWTRVYALTFFSGNSLDAFQTNPLAQPVEPGKQIDVTVDMQAPETPGVYQSNWMLSNEEGQLFGIGPNGDAPFWVKIEVVPAINETLQPTPTVTPTPVVYLEGEVFMDAGDRFDLDSGAINPADMTTSDFVYQTGDDPTHVLLTMNGAEWALFDEDEPTYGDCAAVKVSGNAISFNDVPEGNHVCYRTSDALLGQFLIVGIEADQSLLIRFLTWSVQ
jgi:hypothetical protein